MTRAGLSWFDRLVARLEEARRWSDQEVARLIGDTRSAWIGHARDATIRDGAASGGVVTALLIALLEEGEVDGALVWRTHFDEGDIVLRPFIASDVEGVLSARSSHYLPSRFRRDAMPLIREFDGRLAVVALPSAAAFLDAKRRRDEAFNRKLALIVSPFCGHTSTVELTLNTLRRLDVEPADVAEFRHTTGPWRGRMRVVLRDGRVVDQPASRFKTYQSLYFHCQPKCLACPDHFGRCADISAGDVWLRRMKAKPIKPTCLLARTEAGERALDAARDRLELKPFTVREILTGQARPATTHAAVCARAKVGPLFGIALKDTTGVRATLPERVVAFLLMLNVAASRSPRWKWLIRRTPYPFIRAYAFVFTVIQQGAVWLSRRHS